MVEVFITCKYKISSKIWQWQSCENRSTLALIMIKRQCLAFLRHPVVTESPSIQWPSPACMALQRIVIAYRRNDSGLPDNSHNYEADKGSNVVTRHFSHVLLSAEFTNDAPANAIFPGGHINHKRVVCVFSLLLWFLIIMVATHHNNNALRPQAGANRCCLYNHILNYSSVTSVRTILQI